MRLDGNDRVVRTECGPPGRGGPNAVRRLTQIGALQPTLEILPIPEEEHLLATRAGG